MVHVSSVQHRAHTTAMSPLLQIRQTTMYRDDITRERKHRYAVYANADFQTYSYVAFILNIGTSYTTSSDYLRAIFQLMKVIVMGPDILDMVFNSPENPVLASLLRINTTHERSMDDRETDPLLARHETNRGQLITSCSLSTHRQPTKR